MKKKNSISPVLTGSILLLSLGLVLLMLAVVASRSPAAASGKGQAPAKMAMMEKYDKYMTNAISDALDGILSIEKVYWLSDEDMVAPEPDPENYGETTDPADLAGVIRDAETLLEGQELLFRTDVEIAGGSKIKYYRDETILAITWKEKVGRTVFTFSEVKIAHPSQFRRFLADGEYGSGVLYTTTEMAKSVNAVTASSGDYYSYRPFGNTVYNGTVKRAGDSLLDTCYVDQNGDLLFVPMGELVQKEDVERFVAEKGIRFSLAFGPVMVLDGEVKADHSYSIGEVGDAYSRAALCQQGKLHYMLVSANQGGLTVPDFAKQLLKRGVKTAYALDGGQTASIVTGDELMNDVDYGGERDISDILYFATALPGGG